MRVCRDPVCLIVRLDFKPPPPPKTPKIGLSFIITRPKGGNPRLHITLPWFVGVDSSAVGRKGGRGGV